MTTPSKVSPATGAPRPRRKTKLVASPHAVQLTPAMIERHARSQALKEIRDFMNNWTDSERRITGHICPLGDPVASMKEIRRLLSESIAKCKVIPFPIERTRQSKSAVEV